MQMGIIKILRQNRFSWLRLTTCWEHLSRDAPLSFLMHQILPAKCKLHEKRGNLSASLATHLKNSSLHPTSITPHSIVTTLYFTILCVLAPLLSWCYLTSCNTFPSPFFSFFLMCEFSLCLWILEIFKTKGTDIRLSRKNLHLFIYSGY